MTKKLSERLRKNRSQIDGWKHDTEYVQEIIIEIEHLEDEVAHLKRWKEEAIAVMPDFQRLGQILELPLGTSVSSALIPAIEKLKTERDTALACNCGTSDENDNRPCPGLMCDELDELRKQRIELKKEIGKLRDRANIAEKALDLACTDPQNELRYTYPPSLWLDQARKVLEERTA